MPIIWHRILLFVVLFVSCGFLSAFTEFSRRNFWRSLFPSWAVLAEMAGSRDHYGGAVAANVGWGGEIPGAFADKWSVPAVEKPAVAAALFCGGHAASSMSSSASISRSSLTNQS